MQGVLQHIWALLAVRTAPSARFLDGPGLGHSSSDGVGREEGSTLLHPVAGTGPVSPVSLGAPENMDPLDCESVRSLFLGPSHQTESLSGELCLSRQWGAQDTKVGPSSRGLAHPLA